VTATVVGGMLKPDEALSLADRSRVRLTIEPIVEESSATPAAAWEAIQARLHLRPLHFGGVRYSRDELHERR